MLALQPQPQPQPQQQHDALHSQHNLTLLPLCTNLIPPSLRRAFALPELAAAEPSSCQQQQGGPQQQQQALPGTTQPDLQHRHSDTATTSTRPSQHQAQPPGLWDGPWGHQRGSGAGPEAAAAAADMFAAHQYQYLAAHHQHQQQQQQQQQQQGQLAALHGPGGLYNPYAPFQLHAAGPMDFNSLHGQLHPGYGMPPFTAPASAAATEATEDEEDAQGGARAVKRARLVWTPQLHKRFEEAVDKLGHDKAVPKNIMQEMNVEGLTRENVASHLQKWRLCRSGKKDAAPDHKSV